MAQRFQFKRSSIQGKRPAPEYLEAGEIALNTNAADPGLYFEANDGSIVKSGPTYIGLNPPSTQVGYGHGETWYDTGTGNLRTYDGTKDEWLKAVSPIHGGTTTVIYVGSEYIEANDSLENDGTGRPFLTLNRACMEIARRSALLPDMDQPYTGRFVIMLLPGQNIIHNEPGISAEKFFAEGFAYEEGQSVDSGHFRLFNPESGGLILPRGASIVGYTDSKTTLRPSFYPEWDKSTSDTIKSAAQYPRTSIVKVTGNSTVESVTFRDKIEECYVTDIEGDSGDAAILVGLTPHGFQAFVQEDASGSRVIKGDKVRFSYSIGIKKFNENSSVISELEDYYVEPIDSKRFYLLDTDGNYILRDSLPEDPAPGSRPPQYMRVYTELKTHHRLSAISYCNKAELQEYYDKVNRAFSKIDVYDTNSNNFRVVSGETTIGPVVSTIPTSLVNDSSELPAEVIDCEVQSNFGLCGITMDGDKVDGLKIMDVKNVLFTSFQNDARVYEVYFDKEWRSLIEAYAISARISEENVINDEALTWLANKVEIENMRYYYDYTKDSVRGSSGLADDYLDSRHYALLATNGGHIQATLASATGFAVNYWTQGGGELSLSDSESRYCAQALRSEGFEGINTAGGALAPDQGFDIVGIRRPLALFKSDLLDPKNHKKQLFNSGFKRTDENFRVRFEDPYDEMALFPYNISEGSIIYADRLDNGTTLKAVVMNAPVPTPDNYDLFYEIEYYLWLDPNNNEFHGVDPSILSLPYIKRFIDPRLPEDRNYSLWVENTSSEHRPPQKGSILRLAEKTGSGKTDILVFGRQLDPGVNGGWNHVFSVVNSKTSQDGDNPNIRSSEAVSTTTGSYYVDLKLCDSYGPWTSGTNPRAQDPYSLDRRHAQGSFITYEDRIFYAKNNQLKDVTPVNPFEADSGWELSRNWERPQDVEDVLFSSNHQVGDDPYSPIYAMNERNAYIRGLAIERENYSIHDYIDFDDGTDDFGLSDGIVIDPDIIDPDFNPSKQAIMRFLRLLGFDPDTIAPLLRPQKWAERNVRVLNLPELEHDGYAKDKGKWPVEFNSPSHIIAVNHRWHWAGYVNYSKGLPEYQNSPLAKRQRYDALATEVWGGTVRASGQDNLGSYIMNHVSPVDSTGTEIL